MNMLTTRRSLIHSLLAGVSLVTITLFAVSCNAGKDPDVAHVQVELDLMRLDKDLFSLDTNNMESSYLALRQRYGRFLDDYTQNILGLQFRPDSANPQVWTAIRMFLRDYRPIYDSVQTAFGDTESFMAPIRQGLQYTKYYFPDYRIPSRVVTFIGPLDAYFEASMGGYGDILTEDALGIGMQLHLGRDFSIYRSPMGQMLYPDYISRRFTAEAIPVNAMKNIIDDLYPEDIKGKSLVEIMVEKGRRLYLLDRLLPGTPDSVKLGYTTAQWQGCTDNEASIWNFFVVNNLLYNSDFMVIRQYIGDGPNTSELGEGSPGYISLFLGLQIVRKYMDEFPDTPLKELMQKDAREIFQQSKYKPR